MQDGVTPHTAKEIIQALCGVFGELNGEDRIISKGLWPPRSPDLNPCDFYLWGKLKNVVYVNNAHDLEALRQNIREAVYNIPRRELQQVSQNLFKRIQACLTAEADILNTVCADGSKRLQAFFSAGDASLLQEVVNGKMSVQPAL
jgi:hypothetical protein